MAGEKQEMTHMKVGKGRPLRGKRESLHFCGGVTEGFQPFTVAIIGSWNLKRRWATDTCYYKNDGMDIGCCFGFMVLRVFDLTMRLALMSFIFAGSTKLLVVTKNLDAR